MKYEEWFQTHTKKHKNIVDRLIEKGLSEDEIIDYFEYENMAKNEINFCPLYRDNIKCHNMEKLNCYLCGCPNFRFNDDGLGEYNEFKILSKCDINNGTSIGKNQAIHQECSKCTVPHHRAFVKKKFDPQWNKIMNNCKISDIEDLEDSRNSIK